MEEDDVTDDDSAIAEAIFKKLGLEDSDIPLLEILQIAVMNLGFGRNHHTAQMLRFVADMIESPIKSDPDVVAAADESPQEENVMITHWLSFAGPEGFRGVVVIDGCLSIQEAYLKVTAAGINPGGEMAGFGFTLDQIPFEDRAATAELPRMRLLDREFLKARGHVAYSEMSPREKELVRAHADVICEDRNDNS